MILSTCSFLLMVAVDISSLSYNDSSAILKDLLIDYDKRILPYGRGPVMVNMTIVLAILIELRENEQVAAYVISHTQRWYDRRLTWNPVHYRGQKELIVPESLVWVPKLFVYNSLETKEMLTENRFDVRVSHDGAVKINIPQFVTCICRLSIEQFPFDTQFCAIAQASPLLNIQEMDVYATPPPKDSYFAGNAEWALFNVTVKHMSFLEDGEYRAEVHYIFHLQRRPIYYITVIVAPTFLISCLSILGIFSPGSNDGPRNEKVSLGLGSLLAMTVLLGIVAGAMPKSNAIPLLGYYILIVIILCAVAVAISMAFLAISRQFIEKGQVPSDRVCYYLCMTRSHKRRQTLRYSCLPTFRDDEGDEKCGSNGCAGIARPAFKISHVLTRRRRVIIDSEDDGSPFTPYRFKLADFAMIYRLLEEVADSQRIFRKKLEQKYHRRLVEQEWSQVFTRFDYFFLFVFQLMNLAALGAFLRFAWMPTPEMREQLL